MAVDYGRDLSCTSDLDPLLRDVTGDDLMAQVCLHRLFCRQGRLLSNPVDNTLDLRDEIAKGIKPGDETTIQGKCASALVGDQRIISASIKATFAPLTNTLTLSISGQGARGPFNLTVAATALTVELLRT